MNFFKFAIGLGAVCFSVSGYAADRLYSCEILSGRHTGYSVNVIRSSSGELKITLLESMNSLVTYTIIQNENTCKVIGTCFYAESKAKIEGRTMKMDLAVSTKLIRQKEKSGLLSTASFDSFDLRNPPGNQRLRDENVSLICEKKF